MARNRDDETWHRLREWTKDQKASERLSSQILIHEGFEDLDPSHPLGGKDGGKDAITNKDGMKFVMAVYFPRGQQPFKTIKDKFQEDLAGVKKNDANGIAFVTNQELRLGEREKLKKLDTSVDVELYHLERITTILDIPNMAKVRQQFLDIEAEDTPQLHLGGQGGASPGAGGGGGAAIGPNATGGDGGPGGNINLNGTPEEAFDLGKAFFLGIGGGGAGADGKDGVGGGGGGGGECISEILEIGTDSGVHSMQITIGQGGQGGQPGEGTVAHFRDNDSRVLKSIITKGGKAGAPPYVPPPSRTPTDDDLKSGLKVIGILAAEMLRIKNSLWTVLDGGLDWVQPFTNPFEITLYLLVEIETGSIKPDTYLKLKLVVLDPNGLQVHEQDQIMQVNNSPVHRARDGCALRLSGSLPGLWRVQVVAGPQVIGEFPIEIRLPHK